jgi:hypothetical protein
MDKSLCVGCFILPATVAPGTYTMQWYWIFNPGQAYSTCIDVVLGNGGPAGPPPPPPPPTSTSPLPSSEFFFFSFVCVFFLTPLLLFPFPASVSLSQDTFIVTKYPTTFSGSSSFTVSMKYNVVGDRMAIVDILSGR